MIDDGCPRCDHTKWVCENHPNRPWGGLSVRADACECSAGMLCECAKHLAPGERCD